MANNWFFSRRFTRGKGPLGLLEDIWTLQNTMQKLPTRKELMMYRTLKYDKTAQNSETIAEMLSAEVLQLVKNKWYEVTPSGMSLLKQYGII